MEKAKEFLEKALQFDPDDAWTNEVLGMVYLKEKNYEKAKNFLEKALKLNPNIGEFYHNLGVYYNKIGKDEKAIEYYEKVINLNPRITVTYSNLGYNFYSKDKEKALEYFKKFIEFGGAKEVNIENVKEKVLELEIELKKEFSAISIEKLNKIGEDFLN